MNIQTRSEFNLFLHELAHAPTVAFDCETNGLSIHQDSRMISISIYLPHNDKTYNLPFRHGEGVVQGAAENFESATWQGDAKKLAYLSYWFDQMKPSIDFQNLPIEWLEDLKAVWGLPSVTYIGHNTRFDLHVLANEGFPEPEMVHDTMIALHTIHEDWGGIKFNAPFKWTNTDKNKGLCSKLDVGTWAHDPDGKLSLKWQYGNRQLKWQAARLKLPCATDGEIELNQAIRTFEGQMSLYIINHYDDVMNDDLILASFLKAMKNDNVSEELWAKQLSKIEAKIEIDDKAHMWMLPSSFVAKYAELDTKLTYGLYQWCMEALKSWDNEALFADMSRIQYHLAYRMERNGFKIDVDTAKAEMEKLQPRISDLEYIISLASVGICWDKPEYLAHFSPTGCNPASPKQLLAFLNSGILECEAGAEFWPEWWDLELRLDLTTYEGVKVAATNKEALEPYEDSAIVRIIREHRRMNKSANTYLANWLAARDADDIVRFSINADGTSTGRTSSSGDAGNGQNIPDRNGYTIKRSIVPYGKDWRLWAIDYGQLELRLAAWVAEGLKGFDPNMTMTNLFISGEDMHSYVRDMVGIRQVLFEDLTAREILLRLGYTDFSKYTEQDMEDTVAKYCRQIAKTMNFGLLYSGTEYMLSKLLKITKPTAKILVTKWRNLFPAFPKAQEYYTNLALTRRKRPAGEFLSMYVTQPISNRHRRIDMYPTWLTYWEDGIEKGFNPRETEAKKTWNSTVQGLGGYLCMMSGTRFQEQYGNEHVRMFAQIHDALEGFVHTNHMEDVFGLGKMMCDWPEIIPALTVDVQGSKDGTWQGMSTIRHTTRWMLSKGQEGYDIVKDHLKRTIYKWDVEVSHNGQTYTDFIYGIDLNDAERDHDIFKEATQLYPNERIEITILNPDKRIPA